VNAPLNAEQVLAEIASGARPFYEAVWSACTTDEKVALRQLAEEGLVNPNNAAAISRMLSAGLVRRRQTFHLMNETFRRFVIGAASHDVIAAWEASARGGHDPVRAAACRALARVASALVARHGQVWGDRDTIAGVALDLACNAHGSEVVGRLVDPC
jgi:hypothetical protein